MTANTVDESSRDDTPQVFNERDSFVSVIVDAHNDTLFDELITSLATTLLITHTTDNIICY